jgi:hypothetical protein
MRPVWPLSVFVLLCTGCQQLGSLLYFAGAAPAQKVTAEYKLPAGPVLILVDDEQDLVQPSMARDMLVDSLAKQLKEHKLADHVTTNEELSHVRQADTKFDQRGAREVGRQVGADTVLWLNVRQFTLDKDIEMTVMPAQFAVTLKVVNAKADKREEVRLWPLDREGHLVEVSVDPQDVHKLKIQRLICQKLADDMADKIAKLFYEYSAEE